MAKERKDRICQCCSCEQTFLESETLEYHDSTHPIVDGSLLCPHCYSGHWVFGYIDESEPAEE